MRKVVYVSIVFLSILISMSILSCSKKQSEQQGSSDVPKVLIEEPEQLNPKIAFDENPNYGGTLKEFLKSPILSYNGYSGLDSSLDRIIWLPPTVFDGLVVEDPVTYAITPALAKSWDFDENEKSLTFHLRKTKWSDGEDFNADDVMFTLKNFILNLDAERNFYKRFTINGELVKFEKVDDYTIKAFLPELSVAILRSLSQSLIYPEHVIKPILDSGVDVNDVWTLDTDPKTIPSTGLFSFYEHVTGQKVVLKRNPYSWRVDSKGRSLPYFEYLEFYFITSPELVTTDFINGDLDIIEVNDADFSDLKKRDLAGADFTVIAAEPNKPTPSEMHLGINFDDKDPELRELFRELDFRVALEHAIDRESIIEIAYNGLAILPGTPVLPSNKAFYNPQIEKIRRPHDVEKAKQLIASLGLKDTDGDGILNTKSGKNLKLVLVTSSAINAFKSAAYLVSEMLKEIGIHVDTQLLESNLYFRQMQSGDFDISIMAFGNQPDPQLRKEVWQPGADYYYMHQEVRDGKGGVIESKMFSWEKEVFDLFEKGQTSVDTAQRKKYYDRWQEIFAEQLPVIFLAKSKTIMGAQKNLGNFGESEEGILFYRGTLFRK